MVEMAVFLAVIIVWQYFFFGPDNNHTMYVCLYSDWIDILYWTSIVHHDSFHCHKTTLYSLEHIADVNSILKCYTFYYHWFKLRAEPSSRIAATEFFGHWYRPSIGWSLKEMSKKSTKENGINKYDIDFVPSGPLLPISIKSHFNQKRKHVPNKDVGVIVTMKLTHTHTHTHSLDGLRITRACWTRPRTKNRKPVKVNYKRGGPIASKSNHPMNWLCWTIP